MVLLRLDKHIEPIRFLNRVVPMFPIHNRFTGVSFCHIGKELLSLSFIFHVYREPCGQHPCDVLVNSPPAEIPEPFRHLGV